MQEIQQAVTVRGRADRRTRHQLAAHDLRDFMQHRAVKIVAARGYAAAVIVGEWQCAGESNIPVGGYGGGRIQTKRLRLCRGEPVCATDRACRRQGRNHAGIRRGQGIRLEGVDQLRIADAHEIRLARPEGVAAQRGSPDLPVADVDIEGDGVGKLALQILYGSDHAGGEPGRRGTDTRIPGDVDLQW